MSLPARRTSRALPAQPNPGGTPAPRRRALWLGAVGGIGLTGLAGAAVRVRLNAPSAAPPAAPVIDPNADTVTVDRPVIDLGRVPLGKVASAVVTVTNQSQRTVQLMRATAEVLEGC